MNQITLEDVVLTPEEEKAYKRSVARTTLRGMLDTKVRGNRITAADIVDATGFDDWQTFRNTVRTHMMSRGMTLTPIPNDGYSVDLAVGQLDHSESRRRKALKQNKLRVKALVSVPQTELSEAEVRKHGFLLGKAAAEIDLATRNDRDITKELKLTDRVPLRALTR